MVLQVDKQVEANGWTVSQGSTEPIITLPSRQAKPILLLCSSACLCSAGHLLVHESCSPQIQSDTFSCCSAYNQLRPAIAQGGAFEYVLLPPDACFPELRSVSRPDAVVAMGVSELWQVWCRMDQLASLLTSVQA